MNGFQEKVNKIKLFRTSRFESATLVREESIDLTWPARLAMTLVEKWGMVQASEEKVEGSDGRLTYQLAPTQEVVDRAIDMAEKTIEAIGEKGWYVDVPEAEKDRNPTF
jgi:hypothetical protein